MGAVGRKPKPPGQAVNRHKPTHEWIEVPDVPFMDGPELPKRRSNGSDWNIRTVQWWQVISAMPHCALWRDTDWQFALETCELMARFHDGEWRAATELRNREKVLGTTMDFRRDLRIRYVDANRKPSDSEKMNVTSIDDYRQL